MTVAEAIEKLKTARFVFKSESETFASIDMAIRSLEAWEKVTEEIFQLHNNEEAYWSGVSDCWKIIDKHLKEVTGCK